MEEILAIREQCWREVAHLPLDEAIRASLRRANETVERLGFSHLVVKRPSPPRKGNEETGA